MARFLLSHWHRAADCRTAYAAWKGFDSPLRSRSAQASCATGGHRMFWIVQADSADQALALLPPYLAERSEPIEVRDVRIP